MKRPPGKSGKPSPEPEPIGGVPKPKPSPGPDPAPHPVAGSDGGVWVKVGTPVVTWRRSSDAGSSVSFSLPITQEQRITKAADQLHKFRKDRST